MWYYNQADYAGVAELADALDLKSSEVYPSYRFEPGFRHHPFLICVTSLIGLSVINSISRGRAVGSSSGS